MTSIFEDLAADISGALDDVFAQQLQILPMVRGKGCASPMPDGSRPPFGVSGILIRRSKTLHALGDNGLGRDFNRTFAGENIYASIAASELNGLTPRCGDRIIAIGCDEEFEVVSTEPHGSARIKLRLAKLL